MAWRTVATAVLALLVVAAAPGPGAATQAPVERDGAGPTPPRLRFVDGDVSFWRPGAEDWAPAKINTPLAAGDAVYTGERANLEIEIGAGVFLRAGEGTEVGLTALETDLQQYRMTSGHVALAVHRLPRDQAIEIDTPNGAFTVDHRGYYRIDIEGDRTAFSARRDGRATVVPAGGEATSIDADRQVVLEGADEARLSTAAAPEPDPWDRWNLDRDPQAGASAASARYVSPDVAGSADLDRYGDWRDTPRYGPVWVPRALASGWAPYSTGRWLWDPYYGWTWVDDAPWGWAPYHYGRWVYVGPYWGWTPGPAVVAPVYAPALVAFLGPRVSVAVGVPFVSWVALGWGEPLIPWWGPVGFSGYCWWGGWGGPRIVNNVILHRHAHVHVRNVTAFRNQTVRGAVVAVHRDHFGRGHVERMRLPRADLGRLDPIRGRPGVKPTPRSLVPEAGHALRPPAANARPVVATRPPQDPSRRLRAAGIDLRTGSAAPPPRLVPGARQHRGGGRAPAPPSAVAGPTRPGRTGGQPAPPRGGQPERPGAGPSPGRGVQRPAPPIRHAPGAAPGQIAPRWPRVVRPGVPASAPPRQLERNRPGHAVPPAQSVAPPPRLGVPASTSWPRGHIARPGATPSPAPLHPRGGQPDAGARAGAPAWRGAW